MEAQVPSKLRIISRSAQCLAASLILLKIPTKLFIVGVALRWRGYSHQQKNSQHYFLNSSKVYMFELNVAVPISCLLASYLKKSKPTISPWRSPKTTFWHCQYLHLYYFEINHLFLLILVHLPCWIKKINLFNIYSAGSNNTNIYY